MEFIPRLASDAQSLNSRREEYLGGLPSGETGFRAIDAVLRSLSDPRYEPRIHALGSPPPLLGERGFCILRTTYSDTFVQTMTLQDR